MTGVSIRRVRRHVFLGMTAGGVTTLLYLFIPTDFMWRRISVATGFTAIGLLAAALLMGPWTAWRQGRVPVHMAARRDVGIWGGIASLAHVVVGAQVHFGGDVLGYFVQGARDPAPGQLRLDPIALAGYTGFAATVIIGVLLAISNDSALQTLGASRWKRIQRSLYVGFGLTVVHGVVFQVITQRPLVAVALLWAIVVGVIVGRLLLRKQRKASLPAG